uniref:Uncharacterized protein n=1 Tax=Arion vulgaris TaxID=1028688 RepID=A0A0B6Y6S1_9EUPU
MMTTHINMFMLPENIVITNIHMEYFVKLNIDIKYNSELRKRQSVKLFYK